MKDCDKKQSTANQLSNCWGVKSASVCELSATRNINPRSQRSLPAYCTRFNKKQSFLINVSSTNYILAYTPIKDVIACMSNMFSRRYQNVYYCKYPVPRYLRKNNWLRGTQIFIDYFLWFLRSPPVDPYNYVLPFCLLIMGHFKSAHIPQGKPQTIKVILICTLICSSYLIMSGKADW